MPVRLTYTEDRAWARPTGEINVGKNVDPEIIAHEHGHLVEFSDPRVAEAAKQWVRARVKHSGNAGKPPTSLRARFGGGPFAPEEDCPGSSRPIPSTPSS